MAQQVLGVCRVVYGDLADSADAILAQKWPSVWLLMFAMTPAYMFHQVEEHRGDRFRIFVNQHVFRGVEALTSLAVLWINRESGASDCSQSTRPAF
jgi:hypothetical protein